MKLSDERLEEIRAWVCGASQKDAAVQPAELAAMAQELQQLRLRISSGSRSRMASLRPSWH